ncbi:MAG: hypothetical protein L6R38_000364 [Xanthoria sp. 2 TBL-2021]|nr:MAG: hypothetical protein L6R38_000364 [Xanthoria sp. 2 TBL-2021]
MPVSHIGLTVSHLPTSCSFFLAALAPLGYRYFGQSGNQIGFGIDDAEFFISQETGSIKASSAHVAFLAPSRNVVDNVFIAALKAGGRIHGEPTERDPATGYYSAAVLDFDDNSIEVMHRHEKAPNTNRSDHGLEADRVLSWQKEVAASTVSQPSRSPQLSPRVIVTNITKPTIMVSDQTTQAKAGSDQNSKTFIGTLLGAAAGAAVAYAMTKGDEGSNQTLGNITYQAVEAARSQFASSAAGTRISQRPTAFSSSSPREPTMTECSRSQLSIASHAAQSDRPSSWHQAANRLTIAAPPTPVAQASTLIDTLIPPSEVPRYRPHSVSRSKTDGAIPSSRSSRVSDHMSARTDHSRGHSSTQTKTRADPVHPRHSSVVTEVRNQTHGSLPPLPASRASSVNSRRSLLDELRGGGDNGTVVESVAPSDSISQAGSRRSKGSTEASRQSRTGKQRGQDEGSQVSDKTIKAEKSKMGSRRRSIMSLPAKPSSRTSVHRSVVSFLPGM